MHLTKAEEQLMQILWKLGKGIVKEIRDEFPDPKPARNTVSTVIRVLESKGIVGHESDGKTHTYYPILTKKEYSKKQLFALMKDYFNNSFPQMASFFAREKDLTIEELEKLMNDAKDNLGPNKKGKK